MSAAGMRSVPWSWLVVALAPACVLPGYDKVDASRTQVQAVDSGAPDAAEDSGPDVRFPGPACGLSDRLPPACDACIRERCCEQATACGEGTECGEDLLEPITPAADFSTDFDPLLGCMQRECDDACDVSWGCLDNYEWPEPEGDVDVEIQVVDFAQVLALPLPDITVHACRAIDPACSSGRLAEGVTDEDGKVTLPGLPADFDGFYSFSGGGYLPSTTQWNEPVHLIGGYRQYQLPPEALKTLALVTRVHTTVEEEFDPAYGHLIFRIQNCVPQRFHDNPRPPIAEAPDIAFSYEPAEDAIGPFYTTENGGVSITLEATTIDGTGGAFNLLPTNVTVIAFDTKREREVARGTIRIPQGGIGFMFLLPRSR